MFDPPPPDTPLSYQLNGSLRLCGGSAWQDLACQRIQQLSPMFAMFDNPDLQLGL